MRVHHCYGPPQPGPRPDVPVPAHAAAAAALVDELCLRATVEVEREDVRVTVPTVRWTLLSDGTRVRETVTGKPPATFADAASFMAAFAADMATAGMMFYLHAGGAETVPDSGVDWMRTHCAVLDEFYGAPAQPAQPQPAQPQPQPEQPQPPQPKPAPAPPAPAQPAQLQPEQPQPAQPAPAPEPERPDETGEQDTAALAKEAAHAIYAALPASGNRRRRDPLRKAIADNLWHHFDAGVAVLREARAIDVQPAAGGATYARIVEYADDYEEPPAEDTQDIL